MSHSDRFIALNVGRGDAFYLERGEFSCLVDGGCCKNFVERFRNVTKRQQVEVDVVVCTHKDSDHANGLIDFFNNGGKAKECWLPATWMQPLQMMLEDPELALEQLCLADYSEQLSEVNDRRDGKEVSAEQLEMVLKKKADSQHFDWLYPFFPIVVVFISEKSDEDVPTEADGIPIIETATVRVGNILHLASAATSSGAKIRWFDPRNPQPKKKAHPCLHIVNASEVFVVQTSPYSLPGLVYLTTVNRLSLVLHSPAGVGPDVLFSSDSGFEFPQKPPVIKDMLVTAPHHGSKDQKNEKVYHQLKAINASNFQTLTWVRSDQRMCAGSSRPGPMYLKQKRRFCTNCRGDSIGGQNVIMIGDGYWKPAKGVSPCYCS